MAWHLSMTDLGPDVARPEHRFMAESLGFYAYGATADQAEDDLIALIVDQDRIDADGR